MPIADSLLGELEQEAKATRRVLERVPDAKLSWRPHAKSMSLGQLAQHIAQMPGQISGMATQSPFPLRAFSQEPAPSTAAALQTFDDSMAAARANLAALSDDHLTRPWRAVNGDRVMMEVPTAVMLRTIMLNHWYHHRGQMSVYLRLLDVPLPSVYGPSADENPFA